MDRLFRAKQNMYKRKAYKLLPINWSNLKYLHGTLGHSRPGLSRKWWVKSGKYSTTRRGKSEEVGWEVSAHAKVHPFARKSLSHKRERGKKVDSTLLDVKASTLQHVGQPYTVGRAGSTRNKETTKASIRKKFELADMRIYFSSCSFHFLSFFSFPHRINFPASLSIPMLVLRRQQGVEHCRSRDIIATISNLCVWYTIYDRKKARDQERTVKSTCYRIGIFFYFVGVNMILWRTSKCRNYIIRIYNS